MKRKIMTIATTTLMVMVLAGCGKVEAPANATIETPAVDETNATIETPIEDGIVESGTLENVPSSEENVETTNDKVLMDEGTVYDYTKAFKLAGFSTNAAATDYVIPYVANPTMARHYVKYENEYGDVMQFRFIADTSLQGAWGLADDGRTFAIVSPNENYRLRMWNYGVMVDESELMKNLDEETIIGWSTATLVEGTYQVEETEDYYRVFFKVTGTYDGISYIGYACYIDYLEKMECYQFMYLEKTSIFDDASALAVINSIEYFSFDDLNLEY